MKEKIYKSHKEKKIKNRLITIRVSEEEDIRIKEFLAKHDIKNRSRYILSLFTEDKFKLYAAGTINSKEANTALLRYEINKIGNNINQIAYKINQSDMLVDKKNIDSTLHELQLMLVKISNKIDNL